MSNWLPFLAWTSFTSMLPKNNSASVKFLLSWTITGLIRRDCNTHTQNSNLKQLPSALRSFAGSEPAWASSRKNFSFNSATTRTKAHPFPTDHGWNYSLLWQKPRNIVFLKWQVEFENNYFWVKIQFPIAGKAVSFLSNHGKANINPVTFAIKQSK